MTPIQAQTRTVNLSRSNNPAKISDYIVDFIRLDSAIFFSIEMHGADIKKVRTCKQGTEIIIIISTRLLVVFNGELLSSKKEKSKLSTVNYKDIESIKKIEKNESIELYGKKGKNGALIIKTKDSVSCE